MHPPTRRGFLEGWRSVFCAHYKQSDEKRELSEDPVHEKQFYEAKVDEARQQKDRILETYRRQENQRWTARIN